MAGISDIRHELCLALALWNGAGPDPQGADVRAHGPAGQPRRGRQGVLVVPRGAAQPRAAALALPLPAGARSRTTSSSTTAAACEDPELELLDTGVFDEDRYWSVDVTYAKASPTEVLARIDGREPRPRRGDPRGAADAVVPEHLALERRRRAPADRRDGSALAVADHRPGGLPARGRARAGRRGARDALLRERDERRAHVRRRGRDAVPEGRDQRPRRRRGRHGQPGRARDQGGAALPRDRAGGGRAELRLRLHRPATAGGDRDRRLVGRRLRRGRARSRGAMPTSSTARSRRRARRRRRCGCCARPAPGWSGASRSTRTTCAAGSTATRATPPPPEAHRHGRNAAGGTSTRSTCSPCRTRGSTRGSRPGTWPSTRSPWAHLDPAFAKYQLDRPAARVVPAPQRRAPGVRVELRRRQPAGARAGGDPRVRHRRRHATRAFLERVFQKLLLNFTWWLNRQDPDGNNLFGGGFLGLDNISPIDRSNLPPACRSSRRTARPGWRTTRWRCSCSRSQLARAERRLRRHGRQVPGAVPADHAGPRESRACSTPRTGSSTTGSCGTTGERVAVKVQTHRRLDPHPACGCAFDPGGPRRRSERPAGSPPQTWEDARRQRWSDGCASSATSAPSSSR